MTVKLNTLTAALTLGMTCVTLLCQEAVFGENLWAHTPRLDDLLVVHACAFCRPQLFRLLHQDDNLDELQVCAKAVF